MPAHNGRPFTAILPVLLVVAAVGRASDGRAEPLQRYGVDAGEFASIERLDPDAASKVERGETLLRTAKTPSEIEQAIVLLHGAAKEFPRSEFIKRRECQALTLLGRHAEAVKACGQALFERHTSGLGLRATVGALMSGPNPPTSTEVGYAMVHAIRAQQVMSNEPTGYAARCDIAEKLGDIDMLKGCIKELNRVAPKHQETERAEAFLASTRPGPRTASGWLALALLGIGTALHAVLRRRRPAIAVVGVLLFAGALPKTTLAAAPAGLAADQRPAIAGQLSKHSVDDDNPDQSVPTPEQRDADPVEYGYFIMDLGDHAEWAIKKGDHKKAARLYRALVKAVPDMSIGYVKACEQYELANDVPSAIQFCAGALSAKGVTLADYSHYARLTLAKKALTPADISTLDSVVGHLEEDPKTTSVALDIQCTLGAHEGDLKRLEDCAPKLSAIAPDNPKSLFYQWALAIQKKDYATAERFLARAKAKSPAGAQVAQMERATFDAMPPWRKGLRAFRDWRFGAAVSITLFLALSALLLRRRTVSTTPSH